MKYLVILNEDGGGASPDGGDAANYQAQIGGTRTFSDPSNQVYAMTQWDGQARPGMCALSPEMEILACWNGADDSDGWAAILAHAGR